MFNIWPFNKISLTQKLDDALAREKELSRKLRKAELQIDDLKCRNRQQAAALRGDQSWQAEKRFMCAKVPSTTQNNKPAPQPTSKQTPSTHGASSQAGRDEMLTGVVIGAAVTASVMDSSSDVHCGTSDTNSTCGDI